MTNDELVPEIHDIGKLINKKSSKIEHNFEGYPGKFEELPEIKENATWKGIKEHHCQLPREGREKVFEEYPRCRETMILCLADNLASAVSRHIEAPGHSIYSVYKLWSPSQDIIRLSDAIEAHSTGKERIENIVNFVNRNPNKEEYFKEFGEYLKSRCEDAHHGCNITNLLTHSVLTGKFYRILKNIDMLQIDFESATKNQICDFVNEKLPKEIKLTFIKCKLKFPHYIHRTKDMNIFKIKEKLFNDFEKYPELIFKTSDEMILFSKDENILDKLAIELEKYGLILEVVKGKDTLYKNEFKNNFLKILNEKGECKSYYPKMIEEISSTVGICEICQSNPIKNYETLSDYEKQLVTDEKSGSIDKLCEKCLEIRKYGESLKLLSKWEEGSLTWIKISLDFGKLAETLRQLYINYLKTFKIEKPEERVEIRPSIISEFQFDYINFLKQFNKKMHEIFDIEEKKVQDVLEDLFCIKIDKLSEVLKILELYNELTNGFFPKFKETSESPIKLSISCSGVKFPFFEHWRYLENPENDVNVILIGKGKPLQINLKQLDSLLSLELKDKNALEKLAKISETSEQLAFLEVFSEEGVKKYPEIQKAVGQYGLKFSDILTYAKIKSD